MTRAEMEKSIDVGHDILFTLRGRKYAICPDENGPSIAERLTGRNRRDFSCGRALLEEYRIDGIPLGELLEMITVEEIY